MRTTSRAFLQRVSPVFFVLPLLLLANVFLVEKALVAGTVFKNPDFSYVVDIPVGWEVLDAEHSGFVSFTDPDRLAVLQIIAFPGEQFVTALEIDSFIRERFGASGEKSSFRFGRDHAVFADYRFFAASRQDGEGIPVRGYMTFIKGDERSFAVMAYAVEDYYDAFQAPLLSALDSLSLSLGSRLEPGPVSAFLTAELGDAGDAGEASPRDTREPADLVLPSGRAWPLPRDVRSEGLREAAQVVIEREAMVLSVYAPPGDASPRPGAGPPPPWVRAWQRYFRMIYRDNFQRLEPVAEELFRDLTLQGIARHEMPGHILSWLQGAEYRRTGSLSDLKNPAGALVAFAGDCDSLGLTYAILLQHLGFEAILMVSREYAHALVGVDIPGDGARFPFEGREWLVAELTAEVPLGKIAQEQSDIGGWIGVKLDPTIVW
ncbi:hypothetical protein SAMN05920897_110123 [Alkalispirochaeta americana]|uniref:Uncharacterized protein n=1 Tax=Alkalispirochaeta americana TaxID=159291 RepID=A0A1N6TNH0_9SPIO|nr:hypothetical protein [Alkalispirochaeta americana]SIQ54885.1 hypothetical protein SAMN05920897_110123 [Alkalispirochaeta americana]